MTSEFSTRRVLVTGGGSGIGAATALQLASLGATVVVADLDDAGIGALGQQPGHAEYIRCDVSVERDVVAAVAVAERLGGLDGLVNCAGVAGTAAPLDEVDFAEWQRVIAINLSGVFLGLKHGLRAMKPRGRGAIVNVSSGAGLIGTPRLAPYCASKHGVLGLTRTAALETASLGVRVNAVLPGSVRTPMLEASMAGDPGVERMIADSIPCGRLGTPEEIAEAIVWLLSDSARYVNGHSLVVDGGSVCR